MCKAEDLKARIELNGPAVERFHASPPQIPDHEMVRRIGQGSYGEVWLARNAVGTWRAVKVVYRDHFKDVRPYEREFSGIQKYEPISRANEGLVDVLQIGLNDTAGYFYYVMELADDANEVGEARPAELTTNSQPTLDPAAYVPKTLSHETRERSRLPFEECLTLGLTLNLALGYLHRHGLIHRDVKPSNIIFVNGVPKLADIGLVTDLAGAESFVGTEGFIPPEGPNSPQADLYALGKVLYEASMGKDRKEFPEPFTRLGLDAESKALMELNAILLRACAPSPQQRYQSAEEMNADLALLHSGQSVRHKHTLQRRVKLMTRVAVVITAVMILGIVPYYLAIRAARLATAAAVKETEQRQRAEANEQKAEAEAKKSNHIAEFLTTAVSGELLYLLEYLQPSIPPARPTQELQEALTHTAWELTQLLDNTARVHEEEGRMAEAEEMLNRALHTQWKLVGTEDNRSGLLATFVDMLRYQGKLAKVEALYRELLARREHSIPDDWKTFEARSLLGGSMAAQGKYLEAEPLLFAGFQGMKQREEKITPRSKSLLGDAALRLVRLYESTARPEQAAQVKREATQWYREAVVALKKEVGSDDSGSLGTLAWLLATCGDPQVRDGRVAVILAEKAVQATKNEEVRHVALDTLAAAYAEVGDFEKAIAAEKEALALVYDLGFKARLKLYESRTPYREP